MDKRKVIFFEDELHDEFSLAQIVPRPIDETYRYDRTSRFRRFTHIFWFRIVATPLALLYTKVVFHHRVVGKEKLRSFRSEGYFLYGNHTQDIADALIPALLNFPKDTSVIVHKNNVSIPILGRITPSLGAIPLPDNFAAQRNFQSCIEGRIRRKHAVVIYPEAHIWPFYTGIRPFPDTSFYYPLKYGAATFCFTNTYQKRRFSKKPKIVTYIDGPFFPDDSLSPRQQRADLRERVYRTMCDRSKNSTVQWIQYIRKEKSGDKSSVLRE